MSSQSLRCGRAVIIYLRGLHSLNSCLQAEASISSARHLSASPSNARQFSSAPAAGDEPVVVKAKDEAIVKTDPQIITTKEDMDSTNKSTKNCSLHWLDIKSGIFGPSDTRIGLPGAVGLKLDKHSSAPIEVLSPLRGVVNATEELEDEHSSHEKQMKALLNFQKVATDAVIQQNLLECKVQLCPKLLVKDLETLFPGISPDSGISAITLAQKTIHDMSGWSNEVEEEREELLKQFITAAKSIVRHLKNEGYWADFIDPSSGAPFFGPHSNDTFFETDERYRHLGFTIEDLGCCKVLSHKKFATNVFVGAIFTDAPIDGPEVGFILKEKSEEYLMDTTDGQM